MTDWLTSMSVASYNDIQAKWADNSKDPTKSAPINEYFQSGAMTQFAGAEDPINAWMWKHHPLIAYLDVNAWGKHIYVSGRNVAIGSSSAALLLFLLLRG